MRVNSFFLVAVAATLVFVLTSAATALASPVELPLGAPADDRSSAPAPAGEGDEDAVGQESDQPATDDGDEEPADSEEPQGESVQKALEEGDDADDVSAAGDDRDCSDFTSHQEAQQFFEGQGGTQQQNVDNLDADGDGLACEDPVGGIDSGGGGMAPRPSAGSPTGPAPFVLGGAAAGLLVALLGTSLRRRLTS